MCYVDYLKSGKAIKAMQYFYTLHLGSYLVALVLYPYLNFHCMNLATLFNYHVLLTTMYLL